MKHLKTFLVSKEWDKELGSDIRESKIAFGYNNLERAKKDVEQLNQECANCPRRKALHTVYRVLDNPITVRMLTSEETYSDKVRVR